ncbi:MAG: lipid-binding SYLF domain-containing protein [Bythopirellula sp.]|nr:lipid-binding SYLF domain-containing protein [Bythopirellula sp.]
MRHGWIALLFVVVCCAASQVRANDPATTIAQSEQVLAELVAIPGRQIPARLLADAQGLAIIPRVIKIGFVAGIRRGHGIVVIRDSDGNWGLPRFVTLTGGSVGWQAGVQGTDVVLVFTTRRSVEGLLKGKFTIGVDAAAAAGPVGRNAAAATDTSLQAEILSYSRSRGLFLGASVDGSAIELNQTANMAFYGSTDPESPQVIPPAAFQMQSFVTELTGGARAEAAAAAQPASAVVTAVGNAAAPSGVVQATAISPVRVEALRQALVGSSTQLGQILNPEWDKYLALPADVQTPGDGSDVAALEQAYSRFELVGGNAKFADLTARPEFQSTRELLREYIDATRAATPTLVLPPPPVNTTVR